MRAAKSRWKYGSLMPRLLRWGRERGNLAPVLRRSYRRAMDLQAFEAAGLYDPSSPEAAERRELLEWLVARGITLEQMVAGQRRGATVSSLAGDLALRPGPRLSARDVAQRYGLAMDDLVRLSLATGLPPHPPDDAVYTEEDARMFQAWIAGAALVGAD